MARRFRPNILVRAPPDTAPFVEDDWLGKTASIGDGTRIEFVPRDAYRIAFALIALAVLPAALEAFRLHPSAGEHLHRPRQRAAAG